MKRLILALAAFGMLWSAPTFSQTGGELRFCIRAEPKTFDPVQVADDASETIRYLTGGVLLRINRLTQKLEPELAIDWKVMEGGRQINFRLRQGVLFSDGTPFAADDVAFTMRLLMDPKLNSPTGDSFRSGAGSITAKVVGTHGVSITFPAPVAGVQRLFDQVAIVSSRSPRKELAVLGPFMLSEHKPGAYVRLRRNPYYWKQDEQGRRLPYLDSVRLEIQQNLETELLRFQRGEVHLINGLDPTLFNRLAGESPSVAKDAGASLEGEQLWFNQAPAAPIPDYKKAWFRSTAFRRSLSEAINREDLCRLVYHNRAIPAVGLVSPANQFWFNKSLHPHAFDAKGAMRRLEREGFRHNEGVLVDGQGHRVEFSVITNAGNKSRERMATLIQEDLRRLGIQLNVVTLDFPSLIERISRSFNYEACLLGLVNVDLDPNGQMNVLLSSASNHQWNPSQRSPVTPWEAEIDRLMQAQASALDASKRKVAFDRVQQIIWEQAPFIYLVNKNSLAAASPLLINVAPAVLRPQTYWNVERLRFTQEEASAKK